MPFNPGASNYTGIWLMFLMFKTDEECVWVASSGNHSGLTWNLAHIFKQDTL